MAIAPAIAVGAYCVASGLCETAAYGIMLYVAAQLNIDLFRANENAESADAPGMPNEDDGYKPPKKYDGKKVKAPNGDVWVPKVNGVTAHGDPHWNKSGTGAGCVF